MQELNAIILIAYLFKISSCQSVVETNSGYIQGIAAQVDSVEAFLGIPYAEPPVGDLRFAKPVKKQPWTETYEASSLPPPCIQNSVNPAYKFYPNTSDMSEDCLYLNIWKPKEKPNGFLRPIIIYFHYGAFVIGSSNQKELDGSHLASQGNLVVVTLNYRLGSFGFFFANVKEADGSMGMYDQIMAIQWVKDNAQYFEGDPDNIILMGTSAGAMSVSTHIISPLSQNLFKRAIILSGAMWNPMFKDSNEKLFKSSELVASIAGCSNETINLRSDPHSVLECLKGMSKEVLLEAQERILKTNPISFYPRVNDPFLPEDVASMFRKGKFSQDIDILFASAKNEGSLFLVSGLHDYLGEYGKTPFTMSRSRVTSFSRLLTSVIKIKNPTKKIDHYLKTVKNRTSDGYIKALSDIVGELVTTCSLVYEADFLSLKGNRVYFYKFGYRTAASPFAEWVGTMHGEDIQYIFGHLFYGNFTTEEEEISNLLIARMSAFAYTGNPNVPGQLPWLQYSYNNPLYLNIGQDGESIRLKPFDRCDVWREDFESEIDSDLNGTSLSEKN